MKTIVLSIISLLVCGFLFVAVGCSEASEHSLAEQKFDSAMHKIQDTRNKSNNVRIGIMIGLIAHEFGDHYNDRTHDMNNALRFVGISVPYENLMPMILFGSLACPLASALHLPAWVLQENVAAKIAAVQSLKAARAKIEEVDKFFGWVKN